MRGAVKLNKEEESMTGITPAYAGSSFPVVFSVLAYRDHPRVCGEQIKILGGKAMNNGSPPRMRGAGRHR